MEEPRVDATVAAVAGNDPVGGSCRRLRLLWDGRRRGAEPGQFVMLRAAAGLDPFLPRPMSISDLATDDRGRAILEILFKVTGPGTTALAGLRPGDGVSVFGPLGRGFRVREGAPPATLVAGGIGCAPFPFLVRNLLDGAYRGLPERILLILAGRSRQDLCDLPALRSAGIEIVEVTEDGSSGETGLATAALLRRPERFRGVVYACGPRPMLAALQTIADRHDLDCEHAVEELMACGFSVCNACVIPRRGTPEPSWARVCSDGPVFRNDEVQIA